MAMFSSRISSVFSVGLGLMAASACGEDSVRVLSSIQPTSGGFYSPNRAPLQPSAFLKLPPGAVVPKGWLREQLRLDAEGIPGRLDEISHFLDFRNCGWVDPKKSGWEELPYWLRGYGDLGYVLQDERILATTKKWIDAMMATAQPDGYFGPLEQKPTGEGDRYDAKDPWAHMLAISCLRSYYDYSHDPKVLTVISNFFTWMSHQPTRYFGSGWGALRWADQMANMYWLYNITGDKALLTMTEQIYAKSLNYETNLTNAHNVNWAQGFRQPAEFWQQTHDPKHLKATEENYRQVMDVYGQFPGGGVNGDELWRSGYRDPRNGFETCGYVEYMLSFEMLQRITGKSVWADRCEDIAFNSLTATLTPDHRALHYITPANVIDTLQAPKQLSQFTNEWPMLGFEPSPHGYRCCPHNYGMGWPYFAETLWLATSDRGLCAGMYSASSVTAKVGDGTSVSVDEVTDYPFKETLSFKIRTAKSVAFPLYFRVPGWCKAPEFKLNGVSVAVKGAVPGSYVRIDRTWKNSDVISLRLPMETKVRRWDTNNGAASVEYGPLTFSLDIQEKWSEYEPERFDAPNWKGHAATAASAWNYGLVLGGKNPAANLKVVRKPGELAANPFTKEGAPLSIVAEGRRVPNWRADSDNTVGPLQPSPVFTAAPTEKIQLIPMAAARLRITSFPVATGDAKASQWVPAPKPLVRVRMSSRAWPYNTGAFFYGVEPKSSHDLDVPRLAWFDHRGSLEWLQIAFKGAVDVSKVSVYWFDDHLHKSYVPYPGMGTFQVPEKWHVEYQDGTGWKPVEAAGPYGTAVDGYNRVSFKKVKATALRVVAQLKPDGTAGLFAVRVGNDALELLPTVSAEAEAVLSQGSPVVRTGTFLASSELVPSASHCFVSDTVSDLAADGEPRESADESVRRLTWWDHKGTTEWVQLDFKSEKAVSLADVYWFEDGQGCAVPASWRLLYKDGELWKPVEGVSEFGTEVDVYNRVRFKAVTTRALRIEVKLREGKSSGVLRWRVGNQ